MACIVYREGTGTIEHGIECESTTCEVEELHSLLASGWSHVPPGYIAPEPVTEEEDELPNSDSDDQDEALLELMEEIEGLRKELELRISIEENPNATIEQLKADLDTARKIEDRLNGELAKAKKPAEAEEIDPVRAQGRDAGIEGWKTMHLTSLKKAIKDKTPEA